MPVLPAPYKNLVTELRALLAAYAATGRGLPLHVTARPGDLPADLAGHPLVTVLGVLPPERLAYLWQRAAAIFFPSTVEAFGYPLAEARVHGVPVLAPDSGQAREIAGPALVPYRSGDPNSLADALSALDRPVPAQPLAFDRSAYFRWLLQIGDLDADN